MRYSVRIALMILAVRATVFATVEATAADVTGHWQLEVVLGRFLLSHGPLVLRQSGDALNGTYREESIHAQRAGKTGVISGEVKGKQVTMAMEFPDGHGGTMVAEIEDANSMRGSLTVEGRQGAWKWTATRRIDVRASGPKQPVPLFTEKTLVADRSVMDLCVGDDGQTYYLDYFAGALGVISKDSGQLKVLVQGLKEPLSMVAWGGDLYFTEAGSESAQYRDGSLSVFQIKTSQKKTIATGLNYPKTVFADSQGTIFVLEAPGTCTSHGGTNRLLRFAPGKSRYEVALSKLRDATAFVLDSKGNSYVGTMGKSTPGDTAQLLLYERGSTVPRVILADLPSINDMAIDPQDNLYLAGLGSDDGKKDAIILIREAGSQVVPLSSGFHAMCLGVDDAGNVYYATGRSHDSIRALCRRPVAP